MIDNPLIRLGIALAIGLLIGLERGWSAREEREGERAAGLRTHALSGLLGGVTALLGTLTAPLLIGFVFIAFAAVMAVFHWLEGKEEKNFSATGAVAGMLAFILGAYAVLGDPQIATAATAVTVTLLALKSTLHGFIRRIEWIEIRAVLILVAMTFLFLPFVPDRTIDPWGAFNPARVWELAIFVCALSFAGYIAIRMFGERNGIILAAITGGIVSSTAATLNFAKLAKNNPDEASLMAGAISLAGSVMMFRIIVIVAVINTDLALTIWPPFTIAGLILSGFGLALIMTGSKKRGQMFLWQNPFDLTSALQIAALIGTIMMLASLASRAFGTAGLIGIATLSGLADVDAITLSLAGMPEAAEGHHTTLYGIAVAAAVNTVVKSLLAAFAGGSLVGRPAIAAGSLALISGGLTILALRL